MAFSPIFQRPFSGVFDRRAAAAATPWYLAGGAPTPVAVYEPKGKADLATSYINLITPGTNDMIVGVAPTLTTEGWLGNGSAYLIMPFLVDARSYTILCRFTNVNINERPFGTVAANHLELRPVYPLSDHCEYRTGSAALAYVAPRIATGVVGMAANNLYRNGVSDGTGEIATAGPTLATCVLSAWTGTMPGGLRGTMNGGSIQALAIWDTFTGHATWMPAVSAAVALI